MTYANVKENPGLLKIPTKDDKNNKLKHEAEKNVYEKKLKSLQAGNEYQRRKYKTMNRRKLPMFIGETLKGFASTITSSTL